MYELSRHVDVSRVSCEGPRWAMDSIRREKRLSRSDRLMILKFSLAVDSTPIAVELVRYEIKTGFTDWSSNDLGDFRMILNMLQSENPEWIADNLTICEKRVIDTLLRK